jgi:gliding motility-associated-like protein
VDPNNSGTYTFSPDPGQCSVPVTYTLTVHSTAPPKFNSFPNAAATICSGDAAPALPATSDNGVTGTWSPAVVSNTKSGTYVFTSTSNPCAPALTLTVTVNPILTPTFSFGTGSSICAGDGVPTLPHQSTNGVTGSWSPAVVDPNNSGTYMFTPDAGQCSVPVSYAVTVNPITPPVFNSLPNASITICSGDAVPVLPATTDNGMTGTWTPAVVSNIKSGIYVFKNAGNPCTPTLTLTVTVNPILTPTFPFGPSQSVCINSTAPVLPGISGNGVNGTWSPAVVDNQHTGTYTFTPAAGQCATTAALDYQVNPIPSVVNARKDTTVYDGDKVPYYDFPVNIPVTGVQWVNDNAGIGLAASGAGTVPAFTATNMTNDPITGVVTATPYVNGCMGANQSYKINVLPRNKDVFVPNVFSPNNDGKNDYLYVYGNYIASFEIHIFNQWGQQMITITDQKQGWDGKFKGSPQPVGVYVYVLKGITTDGRQINKKGSITLVR